MTTNLTFASLTTSILLLATIVSAAEVVVPPGDRGEIADTVIALEKAALERWGSGDPDGYLDLYVGQVSYFDPSLERRMDGVETLRTYYEPVRGTIKIDRFEMIEPRVQVHNGSAILTFNLVDHTVDDEGGRKTDSRWNATEVYVLIDGSWKIAHSHWSFTKPDRDTDG